MNIDFKNKRALIRVDFNVPLDAQYNVTDITRINAALPTINKVLNDGGSVVLMSHLGRPKEGPAEKYSLKHLIPVLSTMLNRPVKFANDCVGTDAYKLSSELKPGDVLLLENLRFYKHEEKGDKDFAQKLAKHGDVYVNDAFGTAHRAHASTAVIAEFFNQNKTFGYCIESELNSINKVLNNTQKPFTAIMGGAKVSDKILILKQLISKANNIIIGGGMAFTFVKAKGGKIGNSLVEDDRIETVLEIFELARKNNVNLYIPIDSVVADSFSNEAQKQTVDINNIPDGWMGLDIGPKTEKIFAEVIADSKTILWNGPMGVFEMSNFEAGTKSIAQAISSATENGAYSLIGGGDSVAAINKYNMGDKVSYVSTGGGALLEYIEAGSLPGISAILN
ncbi:MAG: phosphoglycerate kinase [Bacteroidia bacterium]|nr:phosphoglycerate kinase [Bacteroidia bacterium]MCZ2249209.1 phosphoglycerate kinase [Bacteroidia bacterium]